MDDKSVARTTRLQRGIRLYRDHAGEIEHIGFLTYRVPSCTGEGSYLVYLDLRACTCPDHARAKARGERCKHYHAAHVAHCKRRAARARREIA